MVATGTLQFVDGFETGALDLARATQGSPSILGTLGAPVGAGQGTFAVRLNPAATQEQYDTFASISAAGVPGDSATGLHWLHHFRVRFSDITPATSGEYRFFQVMDSAAASIFRLVLETDGDCRVVNANGSGQLTITTPFTANEWHTVEVAMQAASSGAWEVWIDGTSAGSGTTDLNAASSALDGARFGGAGTSDGNVDIDDYILISHTSTLQGTNIGTSEVLAYQQDKASQAADAGLTTSDDTTTTGNWAVAGQAPVSADGANDVEYDGSAMDGAVGYTTGANSAGHPGGPTGGPHTVDGTIQGAEWLWWIDRDSGGSTSHYRWYGNTTDTPIQTNTTNMALAVGNSWRAQVSEAANAVPTSAQSFAQGGEVAGARDLHIHEMFALLVHTPTAAPTVDITGVVASADAAGVPGTVVSVGIVAITGAVASADAAGVPGTIQAQVSTNIAGAVASADATAVPGTVAAIGIVNVAGVVATADAAGVPGTIQSQVTTAVTGVVATATAAGVAGTVESQISTTITGVVATTDAAGVPGTVTSVGIAAVTGVVATADAAGVAGTVTAISGGLSVPIAYHHHARSWRKG